MANELLTIKQIEQIAVRLRKYRISPADAKAISKALVHAVGGPLPVQAADLVSLMRPRGVAPVRDKAAAARRLDLRRWIECRFPTAIGEHREILVEHHPADRTALISAVQYRANQRGIEYSTTRVDDSHTLVTLD